MLHDPALNFRRSMHRLLQTARSDAPRRVQMPCEVKPMAAPPGVATYPLAAAFFAEPRQFVRTALACLRESAERLNFVDLGASLGGRLLAASEYPFRRVVGFERSPSRHESALRNIAVFKRVGHPGSLAVSFHRDALLAEWPAERCMFIIADCLGRKRASRLLARIAARADRGISDYVVFAEPKHVELMASECFGLVKPATGANEPAVYRTVPRLYRPVRPAARAPAEAIGAPGSSP